MERKRFALFVMAALLSGCMAATPDSRSDTGGQGPVVIFMENGEQVVAHEEDGVKTINLKEPGFVMLLPPGQRPIQICAGDSAEIFAMSRPDNSPCYAPGSGMALPDQPPEQGWTLTLSSGYAHNYYHTSRTVNGAHHRAVYINGISGKRPTDKVFLTIYIDANGNKKVEAGEYGNYVLSFSHGPLLPGMDNGVIGRRTDKEIQQVFSDNKNALFEIYLDELKRTPGIGGKLVLKFTVLPTGEVREASVYSSSLNSSTLEKRIIERVAQFNFGQANVRKVTIVYPIDFMPSKQE